MSMRLLLEINSCNYCELDVFKLTILPKILIKDNKQDWNNKGINFIRYSHFTSRLTNDRTLTANIYDFQHSVLQS